MNKQKLPHTYKGVFHIYLLQLSHNKKPNLAKYGYINCSTLLFYSSQKNTLKIYSTFKDKQMIYCSTLSLSFFHNAFKIDHSFTHIILMTIPI